VKENKPKHDKQAKIVAEFDKSKRIKIEAYTTNEIQNKTDSNL